MRFGSNDLHSLWPWQRLLAEHLSPAAVPLSLALALVNGRQKDCELTLHAARQCVQTEQRHCEPPEHSLQHGETEMFQWRDNIGSDWEMFVTVDNDHLVGEVL